ncbi:hypothetical protein BDF14DRAFT_1847328 [Spinellus fusiger]|nr:hypothetical protein BDF14DRAFT_1847328 [Spinellus fusiger]
MPLHQVNAETFSHEVAKDSHNIKKRKTGTYSTQPHKAQRPSQQVQVLNDPSVTLHPGAHQVLKGFTLYFDENIQQQGELATMAELLGASIARKIESTITHIIQAPINEFSSPSSRRLRFNKLLKKAHTVMPTWIEGCYRKQARLPVFLYVSSKDSNKQSKEMNGWGRTCRSDDEKDPFKLNLKKPLERSYSPPSTIENSSSSSCTPFDSSYSCRKSQSHALSEAWTKSLPKYEATKTTQQGESQYSLPMERVLDITLTDRITSGLSAAQKEVSVHNTPESLSEEGDDENSIDSHTHNGKTGIWFDEQNLSIKKENTHSLLKLHTPLSEESNSRSEAFCLDFIKNVTKEKTPTIKGKMPSIKGKTPSAPKKK